MAISLEMSSDRKSNQKMQEIQEIALTIAAKTLNPAILSEEFLKFSGIVPSDWELAREPVLNPNLAQVTFQNGVSIVAQPRTITFVESLSNPENKEPKIPAIARQYVEKLPNADYQTLTISPKNIVPFPGDRDAVRRYITGTLLAAGPWQEFGQAPVQAGINFLYQLERCMFNLNINEANIQMPDQTTIPALLFAGNFVYNIASNSQQERLEQLGTAIDGWRTVLESFREVVNQRFLGQQATVFPAM